jgi:hypothetical protein
MNNFASSQTVEWRPVLGDRMLWSVFILYVLLSGITISHHEPWGDEVHSWNISKASTGFLDLLHNTRYEGHPPGWYIILWTISKFTHQVAYMQAAQWLLACLVVFMILFFSPLPRSSKILIPFGYYFLFEYAVISRNYVAGVLLACCICFIMHRNFRYKLLLYYGLLFCMSNIHLLAALLAGSLQLYFLLTQFDQKKKTNIIIWHILLGIAIFLPALYFIYPPSDGQLNMHFWISNWSLHQIKTFGQAPLRAFIPLQAWWTDHWWNTEFLLEAKNKLGFAKILNGFICMGTLALAFFVLSGNKKACILFAVNLVLSFTVAILVFPLTTARYAGFLFIGFIIAYWLYCAESPVRKINNALVNGLLTIQLAAAVFAVFMDIRHPFSNLYRINALIKEVPSTSRLVTDYWTMNAFVAYTDKPAYCIDMQKDLSFIVWASDLAELRKNPARYSAGVKNLFQKEGIQTLYMISEGPPEALQKTDPQLFITFQVSLVDKIEGAIEKGSNLYLYKISQLSSRPLPPDAGSQAAGAASGIFFLL